MGQAQRSFHLCLACACLSGWCLPVPGWQRPAPALPVRCAPPSYIYHSAPGVSFPFLLPPPPTVPCRCSLSFERFAPFHSLSITDTTLFFENSTSPGRLISEFCARSCSPLSLSIYDFLAFKAFNQHIIHSDNDMSPSLKLGLLALVSSAAAIPHFGSHNKFHKRQGYGGYGYGEEPSSVVSSLVESSVVPSSIMDSSVVPEGTGKPVMPTGGYYPYPGDNSTAVPYPTDTGVSDEKTTTIAETSTSVTTIVSTIYMTPTPEESSAPPAGGDKVPASEVGLSSSPAGECGGTVYVTATDKVTVTVTAGEVPASSAPPAESPVVPSSAEEEVKPTETPSATPSEGLYSILPVPSDKPAEAEPEPEPTPEPSETPAPIPEPSSEAAPSEPAPSSSAPILTSAAPSETPSEAPSSAAPSSSAAPTPSGAPSYSGTKRGLAYNDISLCSAFEGKASWAYNWGSAPQGELPKGVKFVPMPWIKNEDASTWLQKVDEAVAAGTDVVMGFNEVDHPDQANMDAGTTCQKWAEYMDPIAAAHPDVTILGPSVTNAGDKDNWGLKWYKNFMTACPGATYHAANIHFYDIWDASETGTVSRFKKHCEDAAALTGKPVWVTEFGLNPGSTAEDTATFLKEVMAYMESSDIVQGYAYFMLGNGENQLNPSSPITEIYTS